MKPLPPYKRLNADTLRRTASLNLQGEWYGLAQPTGLAQLKSDAFGAKWLTKAFHATGVLAADDCVERIASFTLLDLQGMDAQGGAGEKAILTVEYAKPSNGLHTTLFVKCPWPFEESERWRTLLSVMYGDGDGLELSTYTFLEGLLPVRIPALYYADISRESSMYFLITECVPFSSRPPTNEKTRIDWRDYPPKALLPKTGKYQDECLIDSHLYYKALFRAMARMAAADKTDVFDEHIAIFHSGPLMAKPVVDSSNRRNLLKKRATAAVDEIVGFVELASKLFPAPLTNAAWLKRFKAEVIECAEYATAVNNYIQRPDLVALSHVNLQVDNAFFWRESEDAAELECGLLDWYNLARAPAVRVWGGCLSGCEPSVLMEHGLEIMEAFASEYHRHGGPKVDAAELLLMYKVRTPPLTDVCSCPLPATHPECNCLEPPPFATQARPLSGALALYY